MEAKPDSLWPQPLTFGGVAAFAHAPTGRLVLFQTAVALLAAVSVAVFFELAWVPVLTQTLQDLPAQGAIQDQQLSWTRTSPLRTAQGTFLWISIDPGQVLERSEGADLELTLTRRELRLQSLFGYVAVPYPAGYTIALNRNELEPWWGAWHPAVTLGLSAAVLVSLFGVWGILALVYAWPVRLIAFYADRELSWIGAWRLAAAALLPGALFFTLALLAYTWHRLNLVQFLAAAALHLMIGWIYALFAPFSLPRRAATVGGNPFSRAQRRSGPDPDNPFAESPHQDPD